MDGEGILLDSTLGHVDGQVEGVLVELLEIGAFQIFLINNHFNDS